MLAIQYIKNNVSLQGEWEDVFVAHYKRLEFPKLETPGYDINSLHVNTQLNCSSMPLWDMKSEGNNVTMQHMRLATLYLPVTYFYGPRVLCIL